MSYRTRNRVAVLIPVLLLSGLAPPSASAQVLIRNIPPTLHQAPAGTPLADLAAAIRLAVNEEGWVITEEATGVALASLHVRTHIAMVTIGFDESHYWIEYRDSVNLGYNLDDRVVSNEKGLRRARIHRNYLKWLDKLAKRISIRMQAPPKLNWTDTTPCISSISVADELEKLDALRERGVLSQEEFDEQKAKLLAQ